MRVEEPFAFAQRIYFQVHTTFSVMPSPPDQVIQMPIRKWSLSLAAAAGILVFAAGCSGSNDQTQTPQPPASEETPSVIAPTATASPTSIPTVTATPSTEPDTPTPLLPNTTTSAPTSTPTIDAPTPTEAPTQTPTSVPTPQPEGVFPVPPDRDLVHLAQSLLIKSSEPIPRIVNPEPVSYQEGREDIFWITDLQSTETYTTTAVLRKVSPHAYWYVEDGLDVSQGDIDRAASEFEEQIYPRVSSAFGTEWKPGVDNDLRLTILNARLSGAAGYFSSVDEYPIQIHAQSNQREMVYMNARALKVGSRAYLGVLAHELLHAIQWNGDEGEETWVNEGLSEVAATVAGYETYHQSTFFNSPSRSLVHWPLEAGASSGNYGAAFLFLDFLATHHGDRNDLVALVQGPEDGIAAVDAYLEDLGSGATFRDVFKDWIIANFLDEPGGGPYSYPDYDVQVRVRGRISDFDEYESSVPQYAAEYTYIDFLEGDIEITFQGQQFTRLLPVQLDGDHCWWSNRGDSISSTLTRELDLSQVTEATLGFRIWFEVEEDWDYGYVQVSTDGGATWDIIETPNTSPRNPFGNSFGHGYTGNSEGWVEEQLDLGRYTGQRVLLRFHYVTDDALDGTGMCIDSISIPGIGFVDQGPTDAEWQIEGFVWTDNKVHQDYIVQLIEVGEETSVREMEIDSNNRGQILISDIEDLDDVVLVVAALAPATSQVASYTIKVERAKESG